EGCAGILWKVATETTKPLAAEALRLTARDLLRLGVIDDVIPEPLGGAHRDHREMANTLKSYLLRYLRELRPLSADALLEARYQNFRKMGFYLPGPDSPAASREALHGEAVAGNSVAPASANSSLGGKR